MFFTPTTAQFRQTAREEFQQIHRRGIVAGAWSTTIGRPHRLFRLEEVTHNSDVQSRSDVGIQTVSIDSISGSESRSTDFDREWRPLKSVNRERWTDIAVAHQSDISLPAIDLIKLGDRYFVRDGHHRLSVAKHRGQVEIEANVTEWRLRESAQNGLSAVSSRKDQSLRRLSRERVIQPLANGMATLATQVSILRRELHFRAVSLFGRPTKPYNSGTTA